jgi:hypothetical protein
MEILKINSFCVWSSLKFLTIATMPKNWLTFTITLTFETIFSLSLKMMKLFSVLGIDCMYYYKIKKFRFIHFHLHVVLWTK